MFSLRGLAASYEERLAHSEEWLRILYYVPRWSGQRTGLVDTPNFYLSPVGKTDPEAELRSTLEAFRQPIRGAADEHALCRFPLRRQFLTRHAKLLSGDIPDIYCQAYQDWREAFPVTGASLVFSSNYLNNPSSMYGHTFIRLHRKANDARDASPLLGGNFSCQSDHE